jgi:hypothetical protein
MRTKERIKKEKKNREKIYALGMGWADMTDRRTD